MSCGLNLLGIPRDCHLLPTSCHHLTAPYHRPSWGVLPWPPNTCPLLRSGPLHPFDFAARKKSLPKLQTQAGPPLLKTLNSRMLPGFHFQLSVASCVPATPLGPLHPASLLHPSSPQPAPPPPQESVQATRSGKLFLPPAPAPTPLPGTTPVPYMSAFFQNNADTHL